VAVARHLDRKGIELMKRALRRAAVGSGVVVAMVGLLAAPASAHVSIVTYGEVQQGGFGTIGFNVPNERDDAGTVGLEVQMPEDQPIPFVSVQPKPGWEVETTMRTLDQPVEGEGETIDQVVDTIKWTATGDTQIGPGEFDQFWISAGPMPTDVDTLEFPALQTYDDGEVVRWIEPTPAGGEEPEHPAPAVALAASGGETEAPDAGDTGSDSDDGDGTTLAVIALIVGGLALVAAVGGFVVSRRRGA
jgi:periplasmic copper chaperone A